MSNLLKLRKTNHAKVRVQHRGISEKEFQYVCSHARTLNRTKRVFCVLRRKDIPNEDLKEMARLDGTVVILERRERTVITVFRNRQAWKEIQKLPKWRWRCQK